MPRPRKTTTDQDSLPLPGALTVIEGGALVDTSNAGELMRRFCSWHLSVSGVRVPNQLVPRLGKEVRQLLADGYTDEQISWGLCAWMLDKTERPHTPPQMLSSITYSLALQNSPAGQQMLARVKARVRQITPAAAGASAKEQRASRHHSAGEEYLRRRAAGGAQ